MGVSLEERLRGRPGQETTEVLAIGTPAYGPGVYADAILYPYTMQAFEPAEVILVFHLVEDLQTVDGPGHDVPYFVVDEKGHVDAHPADVEWRHTLWHAVIRGYEPVHPVSVAKSHSFLLTGIDDAWRRFRRQPPLLPAVPSNLDSASATRPFGAATFAFRRQPGPEAARALEVAEGMLSQYVSALDVQNIRVRLMTLPHFPPDFYAHGPEEWGAQLGEFDLFQPDRALAAFAAERRLPFLSFGSYLAASGATRSQVRDLFYREGSGHLTGAGHEKVAEALDACFFGGGSPACMAAAAPGH